jgi:hypothetical protein
VDGGWGYTTNADIIVSEKVLSLNDITANSTTNNSAGVPLPVADSPWLTIFPASFRAMLGWVTQRYGRGSPRA